MQLNERKSQKESKSLIQVRQMVCSVIDKESRKVKKSRECMKMLFYIIQKQHEELDLTRNLEYLRKSLNQVQNKGLHIQMHYIQITDVRNFDGEEDLSDFEILENFLLKPMKVKTQFVYLCDIVQHLINQLSQLDEKNDGSFWVKKYFEENQDLWYLFQIIVETRAPSTQSKKQFYQNSKLGPHQLSINLLEKIEEEIGLLKQEIDEIEADINHQLNMLIEKEKEEESLKKILKSKGLKK